MRQLPVKCKPMLAGRSRRTHARSPMPMRGSAARCAGSASDKIRGPVSRAQEWRNARPPAVSEPPVPTLPKPREYFIHGVTAAGRPFRPSDWAERLCGVMSCYRPGGIASGRDAYIGYSPYVRPTIIGGVKCVVVDERLRDLERMAFDFVMNFARDNELPVYEGCSVPESG